jgi:UDP-hydrolysing UDP-N-acetyl-D-glucosamine 2-epimerase
MHLLPEFGASRREIAADGFEVDQDIFMALDGFTGVSMAKSLGVFLTSVADTFARLEPDIVLLAGDRGEQLMTAIAAAHVNVPVAHVQAGEVSGNVDGQTRHALARYAHIHFAANEDAAERLTRSGEEPFRIHTVGAPQLDELIAEEPVGREELARRYHLDPARPIVLVVQHPVTEQARLAGEQMAETLAAAAALGEQAVLIYPNNDAGSAELRTQIDAARSPWLHVERNVPRREYAGLLREAAVMVGNSSSGVIEAPSFGLPAVNVGRRQEGRLQAANVINAPHERQAILAALQRAVSPEFRANLDGVANPYGDGRASERIVEVLADVPLDERLLYKRLTY